MSSNISEREKRLISEAKASLITAQVLDEGPLPQELLEAIILEFNPLTALGDILMKPAGAIANFIKPGSGDKVLKKSDNDNNQKTPLFSDGEEEMAKEFAENLTKLPDEIEKIQNQAASGLKVIGDSVKMISVPDSKDFFMKAIEQSSEIIAAAQEEQIKKIAKAIAARGGDEDTIRLHTGLVVAAAILRAMRLTLK